MAIVDDGSALSMTAGGVELFRWERDRLEQEARW
jgi:hypothetical protein